MPPPTVGEAEGRERTLNGHVFIFPGYVESSIVASYIGLRIRLGARSAPTSG